MPSKLKDSDIWFCSSHTHFRKICLQTENSNNDFRFAKMKSGNISNQKYEVHANMERFVKVVRDTTATQETTRWKSPTPHQYKKTDGKEVLRLRQIEADNDRLHHKICGILQENRTRTSKEYSPGSVQWNYPFNPFCQVVIMMRVRWRISREGTYIDCYPPELSSPDKFIHGRLQHELRMKKNETIKKENMSMKKQHDSIKSQYAVDELERAFERNREMYEQAHHAKHVTFLPSSMSLPTHLQKEWLQHVPIIFSVNVPATGPKSWPTRPPIPCCTSAWLPLP